MAASERVRKYPVRHLNPVARAEQRACTQKRAYSTLAEAEDSEAAKMFGIFPYLCPFARGLPHWHLTHMQHGYERA